jgi:hypothetical protein
MRVLNIAGGKIKPLELYKDKSYFIVNVDTMYYQKNDPGEVENEMIDWRGYETVERYINENAFIFMERFALNFDLICVYRFLEHVPMDKVLYFIYLLSCVTGHGAEIDVIVPNYESLAHMILNEPGNVEVCEDFDFEAHNILLTTELLNEPSCPHASIWTPLRAKHFFELEGRFEVKDIQPKFEFDGRDIYMRFIAVRK